MNIYNNPDYTCITSETNPYIDTITFTTPSSALQRQMQTNFLFERLGYFTNSIPLILSSGGGVPADFYNQIMNEVETDRKYNCTKQELFKAYADSYQTLKVITYGYKKSGKVNERIFQGGVTLLNDKFFEDLNNGKLNKLYFVDAMKKMGNALSQYKADIE